MSDLMLMTGASGFLGRRLLRAWLLRSSARVVVCVRPRNGRSLAGRFGVAGDGADAAYAEAFRERVWPLDADLAAPNLGLDDATRDELAARVTHIVHCAGLVRFDSSLEEARRTNAAGTAAMLALARRCPRLERFDHISTAYVAGRRRGTVYEHELDCSQEHHNAYERSKFEAEALVQEAARQLPVAVHRPSIITSECVSGELSPRGAVNRLLSAYATGGLTHLPGHPGTPLDLVPVDFVTDAVLAIAARGDTVGGCFHLAAGPTRTTSLAEIRDLAAAHFGRPPLVIGGSAPETPLPLRQELALYEPYLAGNLTFDTTAATAVLGEAGISPPRLGEYFGAIAQGITRRARR